MAASAPVGGAGAVSASATPARVDLPSAAASYLNNPPPRYPPISRRLGEQGKVVLRVRIEVDGSASQAEVRTSSGYARLDQTALQTALAWRYVPGTRNGVPEAMWFNVPIQFVLE
jgi:periplasmic protein TonB